MAKDWGFFKPDPTEETGGGVAATNEPTAYVFTADVTAEALDTILKNIGDELPPEESAHLTDTLVLRCNTPGIKMDVKTLEGEYVPIGGITNATLTHNIPAKFTLTPDGVECNTGIHTIRIAPGNPGEWQDWYTPDKTLEDLKRDRTEEEPLPQGTRLPADLPQQTGEEYRAVGYSLADTATLRHWALEADKKSYRYSRPGDRFDVQFDPSTLPELWSGTKPDTPAAMETFLQERGWKGLLAFHLAANSALTLPDEPIAIDEFVNKLFDIRTTKDRNEKRIWVWETVVAIFNMKLYGTRAGKYKDPETKKVIDLEFRGEPLIAPSPGTRKFANGQPELWPDGLPVTIGFTMGKWGKDARKNPAILAYFGDVQAILDIPGGKPSGAWAQCILFNLNQKWREGSKNVDVSTRVNSDDRKVTVTKWPHPFTRRQLLINLFQPDERFGVMDMLNGPNPRRARATWNDAIKILKEDGHITYYKELTTLDSKRKGRADDWLDQPLDIRPNVEGRHAAIGIHDAHKKAMAARKRKPKPQE